MNWWPWQPKQVPAQTAADTGTPKPSRYDSYGHGQNDNYGCGTYGGMNHADLDQYLLGQAQAEPLRKPGPGDIEFYRNRARSAEAEARKVRAALMEIATGEYSDATKNSKWDPPTELWEAAALLAIGYSEDSGYPAKSGQI